ncbi:hypothetical protein BN946_scf185043.g12 [Trametes cinnabarina]|uniref:CCHC-type domain-containing protein n=1 Tax=Pycnoporus cinnabarinus TaxID=5643 RepID=A0A060SP15_PYCCI|nr:hypothetical protein BN946_scf185043.g12 [Trametes cinnabarina]
MSFAGPTTAKTTRAGAARNPAPSQEQLWTAAEDKVPSLGVAVEFLQKRRLIPEGLHALTNEALITGLLHLAYLRPAHEFAAEGLIAFAYVARAVAAEEVQDAVSRAVLERAEDQLTLRLDEHASHVETRVAELTQGVERMRREMETTVAELRDACDSVQRAEEKLGEARKSLESAALSGPGLNVPGEPAAAVQSLTIDSAPTRFRRAATLADLLQQQVLVRDAALQDDLGNRLTSEQVCARARSAIDEMARAGLTPPGDGTVEEAKVLPHGDVVFTMASREMAHWLLKPTVAKPFARKMGMTAQVVERTYKLVAERVPLSFHPQDAAALRAVEEAHGRRPHAITRADWIKPIARRHPGQRTAFIILTVAGVEQANRAIRGLTLAGRQVLVRRDMEEPRRCAKCQRYDGHFARECTAVQDVCANCAGAHATARCDTRDDPRTYRCANCATDGHAAWDKGCPTLRAKTSGRIQRRADCGFRFFVTNAPETWVSEEEELARAPPPPTVWSQIRHRLEDADTEPRNHQTQPTIDSFFLGNATQSQPLQEPYLSFLGLSTATPNWRVVYPTPHGTHGVSRSRSLILINKRLSTNAWTPIPLPHPDVTAVTIRTGDTAVHLFNLYVDGDHDTAIRAVSRAAQRLVLSEAGEAHHHVCRVLPAGIPTLEATRTKNLTRPDNVFASPSLLARLRSCEVVRDKRPTKTDHFPVSTTFEIPTEMAPVRSRRNYRAVDWEEFDNALAKRLEARALPTHIDSTAAFDATLDHLMSDLQATIDEHVPEAASPIR